MERRLTDPLLRLVNTQIEASDWVECSDCKQRYRPHVINAAGICDRCVSRWQGREDRLREVLSVRAYREHTWEAFQITDDNRKAVEAVTGFDWKAQSLYLWGECGVGKSHLASLALRGAVLGGLDNAIHTEPAEMSRKVQAAGREGAEHEQRALDRYVMAKLLVLDDLGTERVTEYRLQVLYEVINGRDKAMINGLIVTSNYDLEGLAGRLSDDRIPSRLDGMCRVIRIGGPDWRQTRR